MKSSHQRNGERGNAIALVLLVLSVISIVGAGSLLISKYDLRFTSALQSYEKAFNVADGAAFAAYSSLEKDREQDVAFTDPKNPPAAFRIGCHMKNSFDAAQTASLCTGDARKSRSNRILDVSQGNFDALVQLLGYDSQAKPGWELDAYYEEFWNGSGQASPIETDNAVSNVEISVEKNKQTGK